MIRPVPTLRDATARLLAVCWQSAVIGCTGTLSSRHAPAQTGSASMPGRAG